MDERKFAALVKREKVAKISISLHRRDGKFEAHAVMRETAPEWHWVSEGESKQGAVVNVSVKVRKSIERALGDAIEGALRKCR